jgi:hypothetical protein
MSPFSIRFDSSPQPQFSFASRSIISRSTSGGNWPLR